MYSYQKYKDTFRVIHSDASDLNDFESEFQTSEEAAARVNYLNGGSGLTKRETFALAAIQGLSSDDDITPTDVVNDAFRTADKAINFINQ